MKKAILTMILLGGLSLGLATAQAGTTVQFGLGFSSQTFSLSSTKVASQGIGFQGVSFVGQEWGLLFTYGAFYVNAVQFNSYEAKMSNYDMHLAADFLVGPGYLFTISDNFTALVGGGLHMGEMALVPSQVSLKSFLVLSLGVGVDASVQYWFNQGFGVSGGLGMSYDFASGLLQADGETFKSGFTLLPKAGITLRY